MEVAFIGRVHEGVRTFEFVDSDSWFRPIQVRESDALEETYCGRVLSGEIPSLIPDATREPAVADLAATWEMPIGAHLSVPIETPGGRTFGTLCCFSRRANAGLSRRDVDVASLFAEVISAHLEPLAAHHEQLAAAREAITHVIEAGGPKMALQPIVRLSDGCVAGYEALARFSSPADDTQWWFQAAADCGLSTALESSAVEAALRLLPRIPETAYLAVNVSASALLDGADIVDMATGRHAPRLVLELTEHHRIESQEQLNEALDRVRKARGRIAVDDAGSGYAGLQRILALRPEVLKLDRSLVNGVAGHLGQQAMCQAMVDFSRRMGADLVAEGVETEDDLLMLRGLGVSHAQGYLLGRPSLADGERHPEDSLRNAPGLRFGERQLSAGSWPSSHEAGHGGTATPASAMDAYDDLTEGLDDVIEWAEACQHIIGSGSQEDARGLIRAAIRLHRRSATALLNPSTTSARHLESGPQHG
jgi:EAL domain-containing protein (putative c-di-GMP-specific phosphodiesterase class I)